MTNLKELISSKAFNHRIERPSVSVTDVSGHSLYLTLDKKEVITDAAFDGSTDPWLSSLCVLIIGKNIPEAFQLTLDDWEKHFGQDQTFWDLWAEKDDEIFWRPLEMLRAALDKFEGREHLYEEASPLVCRCFGVREDDILDGIKSKAGMGCRSCRPQVDRLLKIRENRSTPRKRYFKEMPFADWLVITDEKLHSFPQKTEWEMEVTGFKGNGIVISYGKKATQKEEEEMATKLQDFLGLTVDADLSFFLRRS
ncbi:MAG TPA: hypothetical protein VNJ08_15200 [Bacteriovoracaceae bacterium]|nr:hypothetical protein [Bacteriovoracaceae bacterium]